MGRRRRAMLALGALAAAPCESTRRLFSFDAHSAIAAAVSDVEDAASDVVSSVLRGVTRVRDDAEEAGSASEETPVSMTKRPTNGYTEASESKAPTEAPTHTSRLGETEAPVVTIVTETPVTIPVAIERPVTVTERPVTIAPTTEAPAAQETQAPVAVDTPTPTTQSSSLAGSVQEDGVVDDGKDGPAAAGSTSTDAAVIVPDESTVVPLATTGAPAAAVDASPSPPSSDATDAPDWTGSFASSCINETVTAASECSEGNSDGISPGEVHASSSTEVSLDGSSDQQDTEDAVASASHGDKKKKEKKKKETMYSSSRDSSAGNRPATSRDGSGKLTRSASSDSGSSGDGSSGMGALLNPGGVSDVNTSSATYYSLGTGSIVAIVGVIAGIMGVLVLFAAISRKKYNDDEDESPLPYGYNMDIRSVARLSPTFMQDDSFMESGYNGTALMVEMPAPHQFDGASSTSGESADEVPSLRGNMMAVNHCDSLADVSVRSRVPSVQSFGGDLDTGNVRVSALYSAGSSMTSGSAISGSWSSVLASDTERQPSRNTRDTSLSAWSIANLSSFGSTASGASGASGLHRMTRSSSALSADIRQTGGSDRSHGSTLLSSSRLMNQPNTNRAAATAAAVESNRSNKSTEV